MTEIYETREYRGITYHINYDDDPWSQWNSDNNADLLPCDYVTYDRRWDMTSVDNKLKQDKDRWPTEAEFRQASKEAYNAAIILPLYKYEHGIVLLSTKSWIGRALHAEWDSAQVGYVFITHESIKEWGLLSDEESLIKEIEGELEFYNCISQGEVYYYDIPKLDEKEWGFVGDLGLESIKECAESIIDNYLDGVTAEDRLRGIENE